MADALDIGKLDSTGDEDAFLVNNCCCCSLTLADLHCFTGLRIPPNIFDVIGGLTNFTVTGGA